MDVSKLSSAPWRYEDGPDWHGLMDGENQMICEYTTDDDGVHLKPDDAEFVVLARNAFDVMMRRENWFAWPLKGKWLVRKREARGSGMERLPMELEGMRWQDHFTALVEADAWYSLNVDCHPRKT